jgi:thiol:disulfide interchange protein DsbC
LKLLTAALVVFLSAASAWAEDAALEEVRAKMTALFESIEPENINSSPIDGWYTIQQGSIVAYVSANGRYLLQGDLIDLDSQVNLTEQSRNGARRGLIAAVADDETIMFSPAEVKYKVTVFTDVDCTYCRKLHSHIDEYLDQGIQVRYMLYPRNGPASRSWSKSEQVWCANDRNQALTAAKQDRGFETSQCDDVAAISNHYRLGQDVGLNGTPAIVLEDGTMINGYMTPAQLGARLQQTASD